MQDKDLHVDKKFTDQAWIKMESLLDQELPVTSDKRKRPIVLWMSEAVGLVALSIGMYFVVNLGNPDIKTKNGVELIAKEKEGLSSTITLEANSINNTTTFSDNVNDISSPLLTTRNKENRGTLERKASQTSIKSNTGNTVDENKLLISNKQLTSLDSINNFKKNSEKNDFSEELKQTINDEKLVYHNDFSTKNPIDKLENKIINKLNFSPTIYPVHLSKKTQKSIRQSVFASTMFAPESKTNGLNIGYLRNIKTSRRGLELQAGVSYKYLAQPIEYTFAEISFTGGQTGTPERLDLLYDISFSGSNNSKFLDSNGSFENYDPSPSNDIAINRLKLHYLSVPVQLNLRKGRFSLSGGLQGGILLLASNNSFDGGLLKISGSGNNEDLFYANASSVTANNLPNPKLSIFDLSGTLGTGFNLSENVGLQLSYIHGFKDIIKQNSKKDHNRLFQVSMKYSW